MSVDTTLTALADRTRRGAIEALSGGSLSAGELAAHLRVTPAALTGHLRVLRSAGLVTVALDGDDTRRHVYSVDPKPLRELEVWTEAAMSFWSDQLGSFARHAQGKRRAER